MLWKNEQFLFLAEGGFRCSGRMSSPCSWGRGIQMLWKDEQFLFLEEGGFRCSGRTSSSCSWMRGIQMLWKDEQFMFLGQGDSDALEERAVSVPLVVPVVLLLLQTR
jgi:hypothetical protein